MKSNSTKYKKKAFIELVNHVLMQLKGRFGNYTFAERKVKTCAHIVK